MRKGEENQGPIAMNTSLGWILSGPGVGVRSKQPGQGLAVATYLLKIDCLTTNEDQQLTKFWDFESIGIKDKETVPEAFEKNISFENGRYSVTLPFKENSPVLPDNYENTLHRLHSTVKHLKKDPKVFEECDSIIKDQLEKGIIEPVDVTKPLKVGEVHYLPSQIVARQDALTTKIRIVFDASSKSNGICLNDTLHTGPSLTEQLYAVLMRFRAKKIGIIADVQKAFLAIGIDESQRDYLRFLWLANIADDNPEIVIYRFCSVVFGLCCSPFIMNATLQHHVKQYEQVDPQFVKLMLNSFYCDDLSLSVNSLEEAVSVCLKAKERYSHGNFFLRKWNSNSEELMSVLHAESKSCEAVQSCDVKDVEREDASFAKLSFGKFDEIETPKEQKVLGLNWNTESDILTLKFGQIVEVGKALEPTKRSVLKAAAKIFDPLGMISPMTLKAKLLFQELSLLKLDWDEELNSEHKRTWNKWLLDLEVANSIVIPRYLFAGTKKIVDNCEIHGFADASSKALGACVYAVFSTEDGLSSTHITGKSRVAPLKQITIPRLELTAAEILAKLMANVVESLGESLTINAKYYWTDSLTTLYWLSTKKELKQFVDNRVNKIKNLSSPDMWKFTPGNDNPADIASRGSYLSTLEGNSKWWQGPGWLRLPKDSWLPLQKYLSLGKMH